MGATDARTSGRRSIGGIGCHAEVPSFNGRCCHNTSTLHHPQTLYHIPCCTTFCDNALVTDCECYTLVSWLVSWLKKKTKISTDPTPISQFKLASMSCSVLQDRWFTRHFFSVHCVLFRCLGSEVEYVKAFAPLRLANWISCSSISRAVLEIRDICVLELRCVPVEVQEMLHHHCQEDDVDAAGPLTLSCTTGHGGRGMFTLHTSRLEGRCTRLH